MRKKKSMVPGLMLMAGMGMGAYMLYKMKPGMMSDMKEMVKEKAYMLADSLEDME